MTPARKRRVKATALAGLTYTVILVGLSVLSVLGVYTVAPDAPRWIGPLLGGVSGFIAGQVALRVWARLS